MVKAGLLTEQQLAQALIEDTALTREQKKAKPLGQRLIDMGYSDEQSIRDIMARQTLDQVFELAHWQNGIFILRRARAHAAVPRLHSRATCRSSCSTPTGASTKASRPRRPASWSRTKSATPALSRPQCTPEIRSRYLKTDLCLWREMGAVLDEKYDGVRDARQMYKSRETEEKVELDASLDSEG